MTRFFAVIPVTILATLLWTGCSDDDENKNSGYPARPTSDMLNAGPETGKQFLKWNSTGYQRGLPHNFTMSGTCYPNADTDISIPFMVGLHVPPTANLNDTLFCTLTVEDTGYTLTDYRPDGLTWADSVVYWIDTTCVTIPAGSTAADIAHYWYNPLNGTFVESATELVGDRWKAKTLHFSRYVLGQKRHIG